MKKEDLFELMGNIDEQYIVEAENYHKAKIDQRIFKYIGIAASVILVTGLLAVLIAVIGKGLSTTSPKETYSTTMATTGQSYEATEDTEETTTAESTVPTEATTTAPTDPTGVSSGMIEQPMIMYNGVLYKFSFSPVSEDLPEGFELVGTIEYYDPENIPTEDFQATGTDLSVGQEIYADPERPNEIFVRYDLGEGWTGYGSFYADYN